MACHCSGHFHGAVWHLANKGLLSIKSSKWHAHPNGIALKYADRLHQEVTRSYEKWQRQNPVNKAVAGIRSVDGQIARMVDEAQTALIGAAFRFSSAAACWSNRSPSSGRQHDDRKTMVTVFAPLTAEKLGYLLNKHAAVFTRYDLKRKRCRIDPPSKVTAALVKLKSWQFSEVVGIVGAPTMRPDGSILSKVGYDPETRLWCNSDVELPLSRKDQRLRRQDGRCSCSRNYCPVFLSSAPLISLSPLAAIHSAVLRGAFDLLPLFAILAHEPGTGKSYLVDLIAVLVTGRHAR